MKKIALVGNPNCGKTTIFNFLTGLNHKVGNFPGITVEKKEGTWKAEKNEYRVIDLPGTYSIYPKTPEEKVVQNFLIEKKPDLVLVILDSSNIKRNMLLLTQVSDLEIPCVAVFNMEDIATEKGIIVSTTKFTEITGISSISLSGRQLSTEPIEEAIEKADISKIKFSDSIEIDSNNLKYIKKDTSTRFESIDQLINKFVTTESFKTQKFDFDKILLHPIAGYFIFLGILLLVFQALFHLSSYPMDLIDESFANLAAWCISTFGEGPFVKLLAEGIISGIGGVVIFVPQIAFLFLFLSLLEESGYMARAVVLMDKIMSKVGMNGRSVVPLISATACSIPAIMGARTIKSNKERLITIFIAPFISCSARLPVYAVLIAVLVPDDSSFGLFNLQGLTLMALYLLGFFAAILTSVLLSKIMKEDKSLSMFALEIPEYRLPVLRNVIFTVWEKTKAFVVGAGKIILALSVVLWVLASYGPGDLDTNNQTETTIESSFIGNIGQVIEPVIKPLGYDWKIGIALVTSFAAREVFIGTLSTIYSIDSEEESTIAEKIINEKNNTTGLRTFNKATCVSLLLFYVFAMQCMSTLAIVRKETNSWRWPTLQFIYMTFLAYFSALISYQILS